MKDGTSKSIEAVVARSLYVRGALKQLLDHWDIVEIVVCSYLERVIVGIAKQVKERRMENTRIEQTPDGDTAANGEAEVTVKSIAREYRAIKYGIEKHTGHWIGSPAAAWACARQAHSPPPTKVRALAGGPQASPPSSG